MKKNKVSVEEALLKSLKDAVDYHAGHKKLNSKTRSLPAPAPVFKARDIKELREKILKLTQWEFACVLNVSTGTVCSWEQGIRKPEKACNRLLQIIKQNPNIVEKLKSA